MTRDKLTETLESHKLWLSGKGGKRADLRLANLLDADLSRANLSRAKGLLQTTTLGKANNEKRERLQIF